jgi:hypothetical protein
MTINGKLLIYKKAYILPIFFGLSISIGVPKIKSCEDIEEFIEDSADIILFSLISTILDESLVFGIFLFDEINSNSSKIFVLLIFFFASKVALYSFEEEDIY